MNSYLKSKLSQTGFSKKEPNKKPKKKGQLEPLATESKAITEIEKLHLHPAAKKKITSCQRPVKSRHKNNN